MTPLDWTIVFGMYAVIVGSVILTKRYMRSVTDYLAAGRSAGRYLLTISAGIAGLGAITVVANLEMGYQAGFALSWWGLSMALIQMIVTISGWVNYRFRRTRALTLAEFFERRYSRRFRIFAGTVAFGAGLINFGIFPAVGARFFIHFLGLPETWQLGAVALPVFPSLMAILLTTAVYFVFAGGQVAVMITDFIQGAFANIVFLILAVYLLLLVGWGDVGDVLSQTLAGHSKINPFDTGYVEDFNFTYFLIGVAGLLYGAMSWQGTQAYNSSARTAHEGKMGGVLGLWRGRSQDVFMTLVPILVFTVMRHPDWAVFAAKITSNLDAITNEAVRNQMRAPIVLAALLPVGLMGAFAALMVGAFISTHNTYLHSWSSIFIQDVVMPFRRTPLSPVIHLRLLRALHPVGHHGRGLVRGHRRGDPDLDGICSGTIPALLERGRCGLLGPARLPGTGKCRQGRCLGRRTPAQRPGTVGLGHVVVLRDLHRRFADPEGAGSCALRPGPRPAPRKV
jgi:SSS family solute:Na+ symporter